MQDIANGGWTNPVKGNKLLDGHRQMDVLDAPPQIGLVTAAFLVTNRPNKLSVKACRDP
jgi:hypothetical protein